MLGFLAPCRPRTFEEDSLVATPNKINLDDESAAIVAEAMDTGQYEAPDQVVREALRTWRKAEGRVAALRAAIAEGAASGPGVPAEDVFAELEARYRAMPSPSA